MRDNSGDGLWADSAYLSVLIVEVLMLMGFEPHLNERAYRNRPLSEEQESGQPESVPKSAPKWSMSSEMLSPAWEAKLVRSIGLARAQTQLGLKKSSVQPEAVLSVWKLKPAVSG